jgi:hypothetical protein
MPTFVLSSGVRKKTWIGPSGKLRTVSFPCRTDDLVLIKDLKSAGAKERVTRRPPIFTNPTSEGGE